MNEHQVHGNITLSALKADTCRPTARKYIQAGQLPDELQVKHTWRTRPDPLIGIWPQAEGMLEAAPELEAKALFEHLSQRHPGAIEERHLRTFQRRVQHWRLQYGPDKEVFFPQDRSPEGRRSNWSEPSGFGSIMPWGLMQLLPYLPPLAGETPRMCIGAWPTQLFRETRNSWFLSVPVLKRRPCQACTTC